MSRGAAAFPKRSYIQLSRMGNQVTAQLKTGENHIYRLISPVCTYHHQLIFSCAISHYITDPLFIAMLVLLHALPLYAHAARERSNYFRLNLKHM